jgi:ABC-type branched-subunit amino acid transport system substrate-binding protein
MQSVALGTLSIFHSLSSRTTAAFANSILTYTRRLSARGANIALELGALAAIKVNVTVPTNGSVRAVSADISNGVEMASAG